jgi:hypothetical protein
MKGERASVGWSFWFTWVLATLAGFGVGFLFLSALEDTKSGVIETASVARCLHEYALSRESPRLLALCNDLAYLPLA